MTSRKSICAYCGCACLLDFNYENGEIKSTLPVAEDFASMGKPCVKGLSLHEALQTNRIEKPMIRKNGKLEEVSWTEAYEYIYQNIKDLRGNEIYLTGSGEFSNESNYLISKLARTYFKSNNVDCCARLCHAATAKAFNEIFGIAAIPKYDFSHLVDCDVFLMIGTDPKADYPVMYHRIFEAKQLGAKIVVIDVGPSTTSEDANILAKISPNGIVPLLAHLIKRVIENKDFSQDCKGFDGFGDMVEDVEHIVQKNQLSRTNISEEQFEEIYKTINDARNLAVLYGMGATQQHNGTQNIKTITTLSLLLNSVLFSNRGKVNVQGAGDVGVFPEFIPAGGDRELIKKYWGLEFETEDKLINHNGLPITKGFYDERTKAFWIMGMNPAHSMPDLNALHNIFKDRFIIYQHHHSGKTMDFADVVLPTTMLPEEEGTITNGERRVRKVNPLPHTPTIKPNWQIVTELAKKLGMGDLFDYSSADEIFDEIKEMIPAYANLDDKKVGGLVGDLADKNPKFTIFPRLHYKVEQIKEEDDYNFILTTARTRFHFCTGEGTRNSKRLITMEPEAVAMMNPEDAKRLEIVAGDMIKIESAVGEIEIKSGTDELVMQGVVVLPYHFDKVLVNKLTPRILDEECWTPCYKGISVRILKI